MRIITIAAAVLLISAAAGGAAPATQPSSLKLMSDAYGRLNSLTLSGAIDMTADIDGRTDHRHVEFNDAFQAPMLFRHEIKDDTIAAATGEKAYLYLPAHNVFVDEDAPTERGAFAALPDDLRAVLRAQDLSLVFALSAHPSDELVADAISVSQSDVQIDGRNLPAVTISTPERDLTVILDSATHLVRRVSIDESRGLSRRGATVKEARIVIDYTKTVADGPVTAEQLAFTPPATAQRMETETADAMTLIDKPAPHFRLPNLDGGQVSDADLKGSVYVLDFWASWCGPCVQSLPRLDDLYKQVKAEGVRIFAVNVQEPAAGVKDFIGRTALGIPVLLDADGKVSLAYGASAIPETVVVGRDGKVRNIFVGAGQEPDIAAAIQDAVAGGQ
jgi:peroxiredoxin